LSRSQSGYHSTKGKAHKATAFGIKKLFQTQQDPLNMCVRVKPDRGKAGGAEPRKIRYVDLISTTNQFSNIANPINPASGSAV
jgi:hypothetical protein